MWNAYVKQNRPPTPSEATFAIPYSMVKGVSTKARDVRGVNDG